MLRHNEVMALLKEKIGFEPPQSHLKNILGISQPALSQRAKRNTEYTLDELLKLENQYGIFLTSCRFERTDVLKLNYFPDVFGSCGGGAFALSENKEKVEILKNCLWNFEENKTYSIINAKGDSMLPTISTGDKIIIKHWNNEQIIDNEIYVFCFKDEVFIKRLVKNFDEIIIKSDNQDPMYRARHVEKNEMNDIKIIGQVVGLIRNF